MKAERRRDETGKRRGGRENASDARTTFPLRDVRARWNGEGRAGESWGEMRGSVKEWERRSSQRARGEGVRKKRKKKATAVVKAICYVYFEPVSRHLQLFSCRITITPSSSAPFSASSAPSKREALSAPLAWHRRSRVARTFSAWFILQRGPTLPDGRP